MTNLYSQADAIVNATSADLDLERGNASRALLKAEGYDLQEELRKRYSHGLNVGEIAVTHSYNLPCKYVLHGYLDKFDEKLCSDDVSEDDFYKTVSISIPLKPFPHAGPY